MNSNKAKIRLLQPSNSAPKMAKPSKLSTNRTTYPFGSSTASWSWLSASGLVSPQDFAFVVFSVIYLFFLSKFAFPKLTDPMEEPPVFNPESYIVWLGPLFGGIIGIVIPIAYMFEGFIEGDKEGIRAAARHVFLLARQVFMDGVAFSDRFSTPIRVFVPVFYNAKRIFTLVDWVKREFLKADDQEYGGSASGVGPISDISLPKEQEQEFKEHHDPISSSKLSPKSQKNQTLQSTTNRKPGSFSFRQLNALAVIVVLSASGMVSPQDLAFVLFSIAYMYFISKVAFPVQSSIKDPAVFSPQNKILRLYVLLGAIIGLVLPIAYIFEGIFESDKQGISAASPHVFLLASQVFMEGLAFSDQFSTPIRVFVPVFYNSRRIFTIVEWLTSEFSKDYAEYGGSAKRLYLGRALAIANMAFWSFNLFGFLLPVYLPRAFKKYYSTHKVKEY
ncbi:hypothetical protein ACLB2K_075187 [Fragaria x ananassa]